jgi:hypothetical protein
VSWMRGIPASRGLPAVSPRLSTWARRCSLGSRFTFETVAPLHSAFPLGAVFALSGLSRSGDGLAEEMNESRVGRAAPRMASVAAVHLWCGGHHPLPGDDGERSAPLYRNALGINMSVLLVLARPSRVGGLEQG